jgi:hypothetical protein
MIAALSLGTLANVEGIAMSLIMPVWRQDIKTLVVAWRLRGIAQRRHASGPGRLARQTCM